MAKWLEQASQWHEMYCHDLEVMSLNPGQVELGVLGTSVLSRTWIKIVYKDSDKDKDLFIGPQEFVVGCSKAPEQPQSSARPICHSHTMTRTGREQATLRIAAYKSSLRYALRHGRRLYVTRLFNTHGLRLLNISAEESRPELAY